MTINWSWNVFGRKTAPKSKISHPGPTADSVPPFDTYEARAPTAQNAIDAVPGWNSAFPPEYGLVAGNRVHFQDERILWAMDRFGAMAGKMVLELGPLEGAHTYQLHQRGANIVAVEASKQAYLKCLITKEIVGLPRASFLLGDCVQFLERNERRYDLIVASGVLYHMPDPVRLLEAIASRTDALFLWTQYFDDSPLPEDDPRAQGLAKTRELREFKGRTLTLYRRGYAGAHANPDFCGGVYDNPRWMIRADILNVLGALGFSSLEIAHEAGTDDIERSFSVFGRRAAG